MGAIVKFNQDLNLVEVALAGSLTLVEMKATRKRVQLFSQEHQIERVLVDASALLELPETMQLYEFATTFWDAGFSRRVRIGIIGSEQTDADFRFIENVAQNRAFMFQQFSTREEAVQWLMS